jgi:predicted ATPase/DNA-binding winged helix-turn-helix (wHTH) protein
MTYAFADFVLDHRLYELRRSGRIVKLEPKVFDVLAYLVANRDRVVAKDELLDRLWPGEFVSESVLPRCVAAARKALADDSSAPKIIQTVHGRGYRFIASARTLEDAAAARAHGNLGTTSRTAPAPAATPAADRAPFVGRTQAMEALSRGLEDALAGRGRLLLLVGEPGIGKTRTAEEIAVAAEARGMRALYGRSYESAGAPAFWPWTQILRACIADSSLRPADGTSVDEYVAQLLPEMHAGVAAAAAQDSLAPEHARFRLFDAVTALLRRAAAVRPLLLVLDDLHWTDKPSLLLLQFLARELRDAHILVVGTYRDVALGRHHPLAEVLAELAREPVHARVLLRGLTEVESVNYIAAVADRPAPAPVVHAVHEMTDGNPFFLGEVVRLLVCEARLERGEAALQGLALPQGLREAIGRRLDALSKECNGLLTVAAVIGREFSLTLLERVIGFDRAAILDLVDEAATARIVARAPQTLASYAFSHALVREALYEEISTPTRVQLHRRVADAIEQSSGADPGARLAEIAHHLFQAAPGGDVARAVSYCVRAAQRAARLLAYEESAPHNERALEAAELEALDDERRVELLLELGEMQSCSGERDRSRATFDRAAAIARAAGMPRSLARAAHVPGPTSVTCMPS